MTPIISELDAALADLQQQGLTVRLHSRPDNTWHFADRGRLWREPLAVKRGIERAVEVAIDEIKKPSKPVSGEMIAQVAAISANNDSGIGNIIADAMKKVSKDGVITVEEARTIETTLDIVDADNGSSDRRDSKPGKCRYDARR